MPTGVIDSLGFVVCFSFLFSSFSPDLNYFFPFTGSGFDSSYLSKMLECVTKISLTAFMWGLTALPFCPRLSFVLSYRLWVAHHVRCVYV